MDSCGQAWWARAPYLSKVLVFAFAFSDEVGELRRKELGGHDDLSG